MAFQQLRSQQAKKNQSLYRESGIEMENGPVAFFASLAQGSHVAATPKSQSNSQEWAHECEIRALATMEYTKLIKFYAGAARHRGEEAVELLRSDVSARKEAMLKIGIDHPRIDMRKFAQIERNRSGFNHSDNKQPKLLPINNPDNQTDLFGGTDNTQQTTRRSPGM